MIIDNVVIEDLPVGDKYCFAVKGSQSCVQHGGGLNFSQKLSGFNRIADLERERRNERAEHGDDASS
jgi:hypothetical protein